MERLKHAGLALLGLGTFGLILAGLDHHLDRPRSLGAFWLCWSLLGLWGAALYTLNQGSQALFEQGLRLLRRERLESLQVLGWLGGTWLGLYTLALVWDANLKADPPALLVPLLALPLSDYLIREEAWRQRLERKLSTGETLGTHLQWALWGLGCLAGTVGGLYLLLPYLGQHLGYPGVQPGGKRPEAFWLAWCGMALVTLALCALSLLAQAARGPQVPRLWRRTALSWLEVMVWLGTPWFLWLMGAALWDEFYGVPPGAWSLLVYTPVVTSYLVWEAPWHRFLRHYGKRLAQAAWTLVLAALVVGPGVIVAPLVVGLLAVAALFIPKSRSLFRWTLVGYGGVVPFLALAVALGWRTLASWPPWVAGVMFSLPAVLAVGVMPLVLWGWASPGLLAAWRLWREVPVPIGQAREGWVRLQGQVLADDAAGLVVGQRWPSRFPGGLEPSQEGQAFLLTDGTGQVRVSLAHVEPQRFPWLSPAGALVLRPAEADAAPEVRQLRPGDPLSVVGWFSGGPSGLVSARKSPDFTTFVDGEATPPELAALFSNAPPAPLFLGRAGLALLALALWLGTGLWLADRYLPLVLR